MKSFEIFFTSIAVGFFCLSLSASTDPIADLAIAKCMTCHTPDWPEMPQLGGLKNSYLFKAMKAYQSGERHSHNAVWYMRKRIKYDDTTLQGLATYLSQQPSATPYPWGNSMIIAQGQEIYENGIESREIQACVDCHGDQGNGFGRFPRLRSQSLKFFISQLYNYKSGLIDKQKVMSEIAAQITDDEALAIGSYLESK